MLLELARSRRILFFGGKGGVGKTTVSAACALRMADEDRRVLLVSTDPAHNLGHLFARRIGPTPVRLAPGLDGMELDPDQTVNEHLKEVGSALRRLMSPDLSSEVDKHIELSRDAPGMQEAALLERIAEVVEQSGDYDLVVFDTAPSGHTARLMALPEMMSAWTEGLIKRRDKADRFNAVLKGLASERDVEKRMLGDDTDSGADRQTQIRRILNRRQQRFRELRDALADGGRTAFVIVLAAERMPVLESVELYERLRRAGVNVGGLVVNKRLPGGIDDPFFSERRTQEEVHLKTLEEQLPGVERQDLPLTAHDVTGLDALRRFADTL
ncbi:MAG: ArsA family ATPase [Pseudohongiellaceae bacterium]